MKVTLPELKKLQHSMNNVFANAGPFVWGNVIGLVTKPDQDDKWLVCLWIRTREWDHRTEDSIFELVKTYYNVEPAFWSNHRSDEAAKKAAAKLPGALVVEHPMNSKDVFTLYILG